MKKAVIIHTTPVTIPSIRKLITERTQDVEIINFLDDSMLPEINRARGLTQGVKFRLSTMLAMAATTGADGILCACSSIGELIEEGRELVPIPAMRIDEPMAEAAAAYSKIGIAATLHSTILPTTRLIEKKAAEQGRTPSIQTRVMEEAGILLLEGREEEYDNLAALELTKLSKENEIVVLAQASMARALRRLPEDMRDKFLTSPASGVERFLTRGLGL